MLYTVVLLSLPMVVLAVAVCEVSCSLSSLMDECKLVTSV